MNEIETYCDMIQEEYEKRLEEHERLYLLLNRVLASKDDDKQEELIDTIMRLRDEMNQMLYETEELTLRMTTGGRK